MPLGSSVSVTWPEMSRPVVRDVVSQPAGVEPGVYPSNGKSSGAPPTQENAPSAPGTSTSAPQTLGEPVYVVALAFTGTAAFPPLAQVVLICAGTLSRCSAKAASLTSYA